MVLAVLSVAAPAAAAQWTGGITAFLFDPPHDDTYGLAIVTADRAALHLEGRYNYEGLETASVFGGWTFVSEGDVAVTFTPMLGLVIGKSDGVAPGAEAEVSWRALVFYVESEYVVEFEGGDGNFLYTWIEATASHAWLRGGLVAQRTTAYQTDLEIQRGLMLEAARASWSLGVYWFNPDRSEDDLFGCSLSYEM